MWQFFHKLGSPKWFYGISTRLMPWLLVIGTALLMAGIVWGLAFAPKDYLQGDSYRIIFIHVPTAFLAQSAYIMMAVAAVVTLVWRMKLADVFVKAVAPVGLVITFLSLFTGAVWGKPTWGTWWIWDARLTSMLILLFLYGGVIALDR
ncbi:MAG: cytochrome c biogenesis protein CcsA, partial [Marinobacter sp.]|nr:cytochrome c biogenesis protein CcsA [Marinobacter sp.]